MLIKLIFFIKNKNLREEKYRLINKVTDQDKNLGHMWLFVIIVIFFLNMDSVEHHDKIQGYWVYLKFMSLCPNQQQKRLCEK